MTNMRNQMNIRKNSRKGLTSFAVPCSELRSTTVAVLPNNTIPAYFAGKLRCVLST
ncbi:MAG: hypothetical protein WCW47_00380 [Candidatus Paceibacterota bacterium]|jgi:hypothetical protein